MSYSYSRIGLIFLFLILFTYPYQTAKSEVFYRETFNYCQVPTGRLRASQVSAWTALTAGRSEGKPSVLKIQTIGAKSGENAVNSDPEGPEDGNAFWARPAQGLLLYTGELTFDIADLRSVSWRQRIDREDAVYPEYGTRLAFLIGDRWFVSDLSVTQVIRGRFEQVEVLPHSVTYGTTLFTGEIGPTAPSNSGLALPEHGVVSAFGLFLQRSFNKVRIDDFSLFNFSPDNGSYPPDLVYERCQPDAPVPIAPPFDPGIEDGDEALCSADDVPAVAIIRSQFSKKLLRKIRGRNIQSYRDRALVKLISIGLSLPAVAGILPTDLIKVGRRYYLKVNGGQLFRISRDLASVVGSYLRRSGVGASPDQPAFRRVTPDGRNVTADPMCDSDIYSLIRYYAERAGVFGKIVFI